MFCVVIPALSVSSCFDVSLLLTETDPLYSAALWLLLCALLVGDLSGTRHIRTTANDDELLSVTASF